MADNLLFKDRIQHALHGRFHILDCLIDYLVQSHIHFLALCYGLRRHIRSYVKADDDGVGSRCQRYVGFVDGANAAVDYLYHNFFIGQLHKTLLHCFHRTLYVSLDDDRQFLDIAGLDLAEQVIQ